MTADVLTLPTPLALRPATCLRAVPMLSRDERRCLLERLAEDTCTGVPPDPKVTGILLAALASEALTPAEAAAKWGDVLAEYDRWAAYEAGEPLLRDMQPGLAAADLDAAVNDITDGTDTYRGARR